MIPPNEFNIFLEKVVKYCQSDRLSELEMLIDSSNQKCVWKVDNKLLYQIQPFFRCLKKLALCGVGEIYNFCEMEPIFLQQMTFPDLKVLTIQHLSFDTDYLKLLPKKLCSNLTELRLFQLKRRSYSTIQQFEEFIHRFSSLEVFVDTSLINSELDFLDIAKVMLQRFPNLHGFGYALSRNEIDLNKMDYTILSNFTNLSEFYLVSEKCLVNAHAIFRFLPNVKVLGIWPSTLRHPPVEIRRIVKTIRETISKRGSDDRVHLLVNQEQYNEFKVIKNIEKIISLSILNYSTIIKITA